MTKVKCGNCGEDVRCIGCGKVAERVNCTGEDWRVRGEVLRHQCERGVWNLAISVVEAAGAGRGVNSHELASRGAFETAVETVLGEVLTVCRERGGQYGDGYQLENLSVGNLAALLPGKTRVELRMVLVTALCDVKLQRLAQGWKEDSAVDLINYLAALIYWRRETVGSANPPITPSSVKG